MPTVIGGRKLRRENAALRAEVAVLRERMAAGEMTEAQAYAAYCQHVYGHPVPMAGRSICGTGCTGRGPGLACQPGRALYNQWQAAARGLVSGGPGAPVRTSGRRR